MMVKAAAGYLVAVWLFFAAGQHVGASHKAYPMLSRKISTVVSTLNDTLPVEPRSLFQTVRGDPLCLREAI
jgi:hypothetical protein